MKWMNCPCGHLIEGESDEDFVEAVNDHFQEAHPEMFGKYTEEQMLSRAQDS